MSTAIFFGPLFAYFISVLIATGAGYYATRNPVVVAGLAVFVTVMFAIAVLYGFIQLS